MLLLLLLVVASSSKISVDQANDKMLDTHKQSKPKHKDRQKLSQSRHFLVSDKGGHHYLLHTKTQHYKDGKGSTSDAPRQVKKGSDLWLDGCSLKERQGEKKQLDIPGCGGSVNLACSGGCLNIHKVLHFTKTWISCEGLSNMNHFQRSKYHADASKKF